MLVILLAIVLLDGPSNGRSWGLLAVAGVIGIADCAAYMRRPDVAAPTAVEGVRRPLEAIAGILVGAAFVVLGVLAGLGVIAVG